MTNHKILHVNLFLYFLIIPLLLNNSCTKAQTTIDFNAKVEKIADGFSFVEGPVWKEGVGLLFSDVVRAKIYKWDEKDSISVYMERSDSTNGLTFDLEGRLVAGQMGKRRIVRFEHDGTQTALASTYQGKKFNSPNDLVVKSDGSIFFTDPDFNIPGGKAKKELSFNGIFRISPNGNLQLLDSSLDLPNGICFSPDEKKLYVNDSQKRIIYVWDVVDDSTIANKRELNRIPTTGYADGMKVDSDGNVYCSGPTGVWVYSPEGTFLGRIPIPGSASNCNWGDIDRKTLYITGGTSVYRVRPIITSIDNKQGNNIIHSFELHQNYPNPFNPSTVIAWQISNAAYVSLRVYDTIGSCVATLVEEYKAPGLYYSTFDINNYQLSSGIYFYTLSTGTFSETKKMVYLR